MRRLISAEPTGRMPWKAVLCHEAPMGRDCRGTH